MVIPMKKLYSFILAIVLLLALAACSNNQDSFDSNNPGSSNGSTPDTSPGISGSDPSGEDRPDNPDVFYFMYQGVRIDLDQDIDQIVAQIGEPLDILERPSCAFGEDEIDLVYFYPGELEIYTYPAGGKNYIYIIGIFDDSIHRTAEGNIWTGFPAQAIVDAYGNDYIYETGRYTFQRGLTSLEFIMKDNNVDIIRYRLDVGV